jgi:hypothetical protein
MYTHELWDNDHLAGKFMRNLCKTAPVINNIRAAASAQSLFYTALPSPAAMCCLTNIPTEHSAYIAVKCTTHQPPVYCLFNPKSNYRQHHRQAQMKRRGTHALFVLPPFKFALNL